MYGRHCVCASSLLFLTLQSVQLISANRVEFDRSNFMPKLKKPQVVGFLTGIWRQSNPETA
jgi:hypothetical protein